MSAGKVFIKYQKKVHFFRSLGLLVENLKLGKSEFSICEMPRFKTNGIMVDCSRNAVMKISSIKEILEIMAVMGLNMMMLYTEDTYEIDSLPYFGYMRGRYTYAELKACDDYAEIFGIEMIPCIQTLAHLFAALKWDYASKLKDTDDILFVGEDDTYTFIDEMIKSATAPFRSKRIHIGMDEAHSLGLGAYLSKNGYRRRFDIIREHLEHVIKITDKYELKPMIWSDMYFRLGSKTGEYYDEEGSIPKDVIDDIPKGLQLVYWDYYHDNKEVYSRFIRRHKEMSPNTIFAGGIWTWNGIVVDYDRTFATTNAALPACKEGGVDEVFATMWGDNGGETNIFSALLGLQLYAENNYNDNVDNLRLKERFKSCTGGDMEAFMEIGKLNYRECAEKGLESSNPSKYLLWQDILIGLFDKHIEGLNLSEYYRLLGETFEKYLQSNGKFNSVFAVPHKLAQVLSCKAEIGIKLKAAYDAGDKETLAMYQKTEIPKLFKLVSELRKVHRHEWMTTYKPFGWEVIDIRYGGLLSRIDTAIFRIEQYLLGEITEIPELVEERLYFSEKSKENGILPRVNRYSRIVSASPLGFNS